MEADNEGCIIAMNMPESSTSLASRSQEAKEVSGPSVSPDGMAVTVIVQLQSWNVSLVPIIIIMHLSY
jgi:hypothetical protein